MLWRLLPTALALAVVLSIAATTACAPSEDEPASTDTAAAAVSNLSDEELRALRDLAEDMQQEGNLKPWIPTYIPEGLERAPSHTGGSDSSVSMVFYTDWAHEADPRPLGLIISQELDNNVELATNSVIEQIPVEVTGGTPVYGVTSVQTVPYAVHFLLPGRVVLVSMDWGLIDGEVTPEMKNLTESVAASIIRSAES